MYALYKEILQSYKTGSYSPECAQLPIPILAQLLYH
jgi:hypothetical protein